MRILKRLIPLGMIGVCSFLVFDVSGSILWKQYSPTVAYVSLLSADGSPNAGLMRIFMTIYGVCFLLFVIAMGVNAFRNYHALLKWGYSLLFVSAFVSLLVYSAWPMSIDVIFSMQNVIHIATTVLLIVLNVIAIMLIASGYLKQERLLSLGKISLIAGGVFAILNLWHLFALLNLQSYLGLIQRLSIYVFHLYTFVLSFIYTFKRKSIL